MPCSSVCSCLVFFRTHRRRTCRPFLDVNIRLCNLCSTQVEVSTLRAGPSIRAYLETTVTHLVLFLRNFKGHFFVALVRHLALLSYWRCFDHPAFIISAVKACFSAINIASCVLHMRPTRSKSRTACCCWTWP